MSVVAYFGFMSLNVQLNPQKALLAAAYRDSNLKKKKTLHLKRVVINVMTFQILLPLVPPLDAGMGVTINSYFKFAHFFSLHKVFILSILPSIFRPTKRRNLMYLNYFSRNNSKIIYNENTGFSPKRQI